MPIMTNSRILAPTLSTVEMLPPKYHGFWHFRSCRFYLALAMGMVIFAHAIARATLSIAMVCMVNTTASRIRSGKAPLISINASLLEDGCSGDDNPVIDYEGEQTWTGTEQSLLFSSIYWGGVLSALPAGMIADRYSARLVVLYCLVLQALGCLLTPVTVTYGGLIPFVVIRFLMGIGGQAVINPAIAVLISRWIPPSERSTVIGLYTGGNQIAFITCMPLNAWLCQQKQFLGGWPSIFYVSGVLTILAMIPWALFVRDTPQSHKWMSKSELNYIEHSLRLHQFGDTKSILKRVPWKRMFMSMALWSCIVGNFSATILACTLESYIPTYFKQVLHLDLSSNGMLSAVPYMAQWASKILFASAADLLKKRTNLSHTWICRISNCLNTFATAAFLVACSFSDCRQAATAVALLTIANFLTSGQVTGFWTGLVCMAPAFTGIVNSVTRLSGQAASLIAPYIVGGIVIEGTSAEWRIVFYITAAGLVMTGIHYLIFGSANVQEWAKLEPDVTRLAPEYAAPATDHPQDLHLPPDFAGHKIEAIEAEIDEDENEQASQREKTDPRKFSTTGLGGVTVSCETILTTLNDDKK